MRLYAAAGRDNGAAIAALILGITGIVLPPIGLLDTPFAIGFGIVGRHRARAGSPHGGMAAAGLTLVVRRFLAGPRPGPVNESRLAMLTPRETEVLELLANGLSNAEIARRLYIGEGTVETHVTGPRGSVQVL